MEGADPKMVRSIIRGFIFLAIAGEGSRIIDKDYIDNYKLQQETSSMPVRADFDILSSTNNRNEGEDVKICTNEDKWVATFGVVTNGGGVEWWTIEGTNQKLSVKKIDIVLLYKCGSIKKIVEF